MAKIEKYQRFGRLQVLSFAYSKNNCLYWFCVCDCSNFCIKRGIELRKNKSGKISCGCSGKESFLKVITKHNYCGSKTYSSFQAMKLRCLNPKSIGYDHYGGRGITVCDRWMAPEGKGFLNFLEDMGERPEKMTLDRIDVNGNYCKENCRWLNSGEQNFNKKLQSNNTSGVAGVSWDTSKNRYSAYITFKGKRISLGSFTKQKDAISARKEAEIKYYGYNPIKLEE